MSGCGARTAAGSLEAIFESSDAERFGRCRMLLADYGATAITLGAGRLLAEL